MTNEEFSNEFDNLVNKNIAKPFGVDSTPLEFDEYEKSMFLTKAQESVVISLYRGTLTGDSFEKTEELRRYLNELIKTYTTTNKVENEGLTDNSYFFDIPDDVWFITYESAVSQDERLGCAKGTVMEVVPTAQDDLYKTSRNPFRGPNKRRVLRLDVEGKVVELISKFDIDKYQIRYLAKPEPIILIDLPEDLSINGLTKKTECILNPAIHRVILETAVNMAIKSRITSTGK